MSLLNRSNCEVCLSQRVCASCSHVCITLSAKLQSVLKPLLFLLGSMEPEQSSINAPAWMRSARDRLERQRAGIRTDALPDHAVLESALHARVQDFNMPGGEGCGELSATPPRRTMREAGLLMHRRAEDAVLASGFHPARHTVVVCGRPVQVELSATLSID